MKRCKITILKTTLDEELAKEYAAPGFTRCPMMREGQVFYADYAKPEGFCDEAWKAVYQYVFAVIIQIKESRIEELAAQYEVEKFVVGLPKNMNATEGERAEKSRAFADALFRRTGIEVVMWDERLTTVAADRTMMEAGIRREDRKEYVDAIAASYILQGYLDYLQNRKA